MASGKMNSLARSNASLYGNKEELYDRLRRHAYQGGKKGKSSIKSNLHIFVCNLERFTFSCSEKSNNETTSDSDDGRQ